MRSWFSPFYILLFLLLLLATLSVLPDRAAADVTLRFIGAARSVGGSAILLETEKSRILIDYGLSMERGQAGKGGPPPFDPAAIDYVLLTHAHADHAGRIPWLYRQGFRGRVVGTAATKALAGITSRAGLSYGTAGGSPLYGPEDVETMERNYESLPYGRRRRLTEDVAVRLRDAGHILGSAMIEVWTGLGGKMRKIVFTGDMGNGRIPLLKAPETIEEADFIVVEATYGVERRDMKGQEGRLIREIRETLAAGGSVLIPAFSLDRTQKVLFAIGRWRNQGLLPADVPVYADSSLGAKITKVYRRRWDYLHPEVQREFASGQDPLQFPGLRQVRGDASLRAHERNRPAIFVTSSGMLDHGNAPRHLERMAGDPRNLLVIVGWQAPGSLGEALLAGRRRVAIPSSANPPHGTAAPGTRTEIRMRVKRFDLFSNHADACEILTWLSRFRKTKKVFVIHGEGENTLRLADAIERNLGFPALAPERDERFSIAAELPDRERLPDARPCRGLTGAKRRHIPEGD
ncbi:MAG: MBL fold metallo-hydrolase [Pseudomonadota bacterium]|nr:MBL fold metallo-hydrolase [Pseudomonadota bacterium]